MRISVLFIANTAALFLVTLVFASTFAWNIRVKRLVRSGLNKLGSSLNEKRLQREVRRYTRTFSIKMSVAEKIELYLIDKSNVRHYIPFMNFQGLVFLCLVIFAGTFEPVYRVLFFLPSTAVICLLFSCTPLVALDILGRYNSDKIRRKLTEFISVLNRWCSVKEDIFYAFEKSVDSGIGEPLKTFIRDMTIQVRRGIDPMEALEMLQLKVDNTQFKDFVINIRQNIKSRGDICKLLTNLENQFYKMEEEYNRRKISTFKDRLIIYGVMFSVLFVGYYFIKSNPKVELFYLGTTAGKSLLMLFCLLYALGFYMSTRIMNFRY